MSARTSQSQQQNCSCEGDITCENCVNAQQETPDTPPDNMRVSVEIPQDTIISSIVAEMIARLNSPGN
jgi:hypothetical protein